MSCPTVIRVTTAQGPPGIGLPAGGGDAGKFVRKAGSTPYAYELVTPDAIGLPQDLAPTSAPTFAGLTLSGLAANGLLLTGTGGALTRLPLGAGLAIVGGALTATGGGGSGSVTSVGLSAPTGFSVTSSPVTGSGTLALGFAAGYSLPTDTRQAQWDSAVTLAGTAVQPGALAAGLAGKADLDGTGKVPAAQLPGFVDDVVEFANVAAFPVTGEAGKLYISLATNRQYRWSGSIYVEISPSPGSTDAVPEGSVNLYFTSTRGQTAAAAWWAGSAPAAKLAGIADNATANLGTVTSIGLVAPTGFSTTGAITTSGNITLSFSTGYSLPTDARQADWDAAFTQRRTWDGGDQHLNAATGRASLQLGTAAQAAATDFATPAALASGLAGKADLVGGVVPSSQIPAIAISDYLGSVASQAAMLALVGQRGDWCIRTDGASAGAWILSGEPSSLLANWVQIPMPAVPVQSVNGQVGVVTLGAGDVGAATAAQGAKADTAIQPGNAALTDAREWSAPTFTQAEIEDPNSTVRRASTGQRIRQAIAAWWGGYASSVGQALATAIDAAAGRTAIGAEQAGAAAAAQAFAIQRGNHTGTQPASTITGLPTVNLGSIANAITRASGTTGAAVQGSDLIVDDYAAATQANIHISARTAVFSCTATASDDFVTATGHTYIDGQQVAFSALTGGAGLATATRYFVRDAQAGVRFRVAATSGGTAIDITSDMTAGTVNLATAVGIAPTFGGSFYFGPRPDGTAAGGNAKGIGSVDLQLSRTGAARIASGNFSSVLGGSENTASGANSTVVGGLFNTASGANSVAVGFAAQSTRTATYAFSSGTFTTGGDCQILSAAMRNRTTNATPTELFLDGSSARLTVPSGRILSGTIDCTGTRSDGLSVARFRRSFAIKNVGGTTSLIGTIQTVGTDYEDNASTDITIDADDTTDALRIRVTGIAGETWRWMARFDWSEIVWGT